MKEKYRFDDEEMIEYIRLRDNVVYKERELDRAKKVFEKYKMSLFKKHFKGIDVFEGEYWDCKLSPLGHCLYSYEYDEPTCIFCGEPEERK